MVSMEHLVEQFDLEAAQLELSIYDIVQCDVYKKEAVKSVQYFSVDETLQTLMEEENKSTYLSFPKIDREILDKCLHSMGMDLKLNIETLVCPHFTLNRVPVYGERYVGHWRTDKRWKNFVNRVVRGDNGK